jgi:hypothetical protein
MADNGTVFCPGFWPPHHIVSTDYPSTTVSFLLWWSAPQQTLRAHRKASYATLWWWWWLLFCPFPSNGAPVEWNRQGKTEELGEKPAPVPLCPPQIPHGPTRDRTRTSAVGGQQLTAWATARPVQSHYGVTTASHITQFVFQDDISDHVSSKSMTGPVTTKSSAVGW